MERERLGLEDFVDLSQGYSDDNGDYAAGENENYHDIQFSYGDDANQEYYVNNSQDEIHGESEFFNSNNVAHALSSNNNSSPSFSQESTNNDNMNSQLGSTEGLSPRKLDSALGSSKSTKSVSLASALINNSVNNNNINNSAGYVNSNQGNDDMQGSYNGSSGSSRGSLLSLLGDKAPKIANVSTTASQSFRPVVSAITNDGRDDEVEIRSFSLSIYETQDISKVFDSFCNDKSVRILAVKLQQESTIMNDCHEKMEKLETENKVMKGNIQELIKVHEHEIGQLKEKHEKQIEKYRNELKTLSERLTKFDNLNVILTEKDVKVQTLQAELEVVSRERDDFEKKYDKMRTEIENLRFESNKFKMESARMKVEFDNQESTHRERAQELENHCQRRLAEIADKLNFKENEMINFEEKIRGANNQILQMKDALTHFEIRTKQLESENQALRGKLQEFMHISDENNQLKRKCSILENQIESLNGELSKLSFQTNRSHQSAYPLPMSMPMPMPPMPMNYSNNDYLNNSDLSYVNSSKPMLSHGIVGSSVSGSSNSGSSPTPYNSYGNYLDPVISTPNISSHLSQQSSQLSSMSSMPSVPSVPSQRRLSQDSSVKSLASLVSNINVNADNSNTNVNSGNNGRKSMGQPSLADFMNSNNNSNNRNNNSQSRGRPAGSGGTPFATESTTSEYVSSYDHLERRLTQLVTQKKALEEEGSRLFNRGAKTLKEKTRANEIDEVTQELSREISSIRKQLSSKPQ